MNKSKTSKRTALKSEPQGKPHAGHKPAAAAPTPEDTCEHTEVVLLAVVGMSPAILTETIWAMANPTDELLTPQVPS